MSAKSPPPPEPEGDLVLEALLGAFATLAQEKECVFIGALARLHPDGYVSVRCRGVSREQDAVHAQMLMECLEALSELRLQLWEALGTDEPPTPTPKPPAKGRLN